MPQLQLLSGIRLQARYAQVSKVAEGTEFKLMYALGGDENRLPANTPSRRRKSSKCWMVPPSNKGIGPYMEMVTCSRMAFTRASKQEDTFSWSVTVKRPVSQLGPRLAT